METLIKGQQILFFHIFFLIIIYLQLIKKFSYYFALWPVVLARLHPSQGWAVQNVGLSLCRVMVCMFSVLCMVIAVYIYFSTIILNITIFMQTKRHFNDIVKSVC